MMQILTEYDKKVVSTVNNDLHKAIKILRNVHKDIGLISSTRVSCHYTVIQSCESMLSAVSEELFQLSRED